MRQIGICISSFAIYVSGAQYINKATIRAVPGARMANAGTASMTVMELNRTREGQTLPAQPGMQGDPAEAIVSIRNTSKTYASGLQALRPTDLDIRKGEIFALLGPNGAGKTTLINIICGIVTATTGTILAGGLDIRRNYRETRMR